MAETAATSDLADIRRNLRDFRFPVEDETLLGELNEWLDESHEKTEADTAAEYVETRLDGLLAENNMYGDESEFPDECSECQHYGGGCPVLTDLDEKDWRSRRLEEAETETETRTIFEEQARDVGCLRIPEFIEEWAESHSDFVRRGERLLRETEEHLEELKGSEDG